MTLMPWEARLAFFDALTADHAARRVDGPTHRALVSYALYLWAVRRFRHSRHGGRAARADRRGRGRRRPGGVSARARADAALRDPHDRGGGHAMTHIGGPR